MKIHQTAAWRPFPPAVPVSRQEERAENQGVSPADPAAPPRAAWGESLLPSELHPPLSKIRARQSLQENFALVWTESAEFVEEQPGCVQPAVPGQALSLSHCDCPQLPLGSWQLSPNAGAPNNTPGCPKSPGSSCRGNSAILQLPGLAEGKGRREKGACFSACQLLEVEAAALRIALADRKTSFHWW